MKKNAYLVLIISCWALLFLALIFKLPFNHYFEITLNNERIISIGAFIDEHLWLKLLIVTLFYIPISYITYLSMVGKRIGKDWWICLLALPITTIKYYVNWLGFVLDILLLILLPLIRCRFRNWLRVIIGVVLIWGYQLLILFIRNLGLYLSSENIVIGEIMNIDYYIIMILFYLYVNYRQTTKDKEVTAMGIFGPFFFGESDKVLIKEIAKEHKAPVEIVEKHYKEMLEAIENEVKAQE